MAEIKMQLTTAAQWMTDHNDDLFRWLTLPDGMDRDTTIDAIIHRCDEFPLLYPNPYYIQSAIGSWCARNGYPWARMWSALQAEYNPIHNYDRYELTTHEHSSERTDTDNTIGTDARTTQQTRSDSLTGGDTRTVTSSDQTETNTSGSGTTTGKVSAFDTPDTLRDRDSTATTDSTEGSTQSSGTSTDALQRSETRSGTDSGTDNVQRSEARTGSSNLIDNGQDTAHLYGNIGVTTSQQMVESEINLRASYNMYDIVAEDFAREFCIMVY